MERTILYKDTKAQAQRERLTAELNTKAQALIKRFKDATGDNDVSLSYILDNGSQSFLESFYKVNGHLYPQSVNRARMFEVTTGVSLKELAEQISTLKSELESSQWNFKITKINTISPKANSSIFNKYLDEKKEEDYNDAVQLLEIATKILKKNPYAGMLNIKRFAPVEWFMSTGTKLEINVSYFSKY